MDEQAVVNIERLRLRTSNTMLQNPNEGDDAGPGSGPGAPQHVVVVEDDGGIRTLLVRILRENGYEASGAADGIALRDLLADRPVDLILLDIMLPGESGLDLCSSIREQSNVPIIIVSARGEEVDRVAGLELGADDYIAKPFGRPELLARVRALLRRAGPLTQRKEANTVESLLFAGWRFNIRHRELLAPSGAEVELSGAEQDLLLSLLRHPQRVIGRERLLELSRTRIRNSSDRSVDVLVSRLRRKLGDGRRNRPMIRTIRGVGYMLAVDVESEG